MSTTILHSMHKKRAAKSPRSPLACSTLQCCCYTCSLIRFLLSTLASPALGVLLNHVRRAHAWWAYLDPATPCQVFLHGLHTQRSMLLTLLFHSSHHSSLCCGHPPHNYMRGGFGANARTRTGMLSARDFKSLVSTNFTTLAIVACPERFELPTLCLEGTCSILLSYGQLFNCYA